MTQPLLVAENIDTTPRRTLFMFLGVPWTATPQAWLGVLAQMTFGVAAAVVMGVGLASGLLWGVLVVLSVALHSIGHILGGLSVGSPMDENLVTATRHVNIYRNDPPDLPSRVHLGRALGGPLMNLAVGVLGLAIFGLSGSLTLLLFGGFNLFVGIGALAPVPSVDGEVIWRELRR
jgi:hypothetical protein